MLDGYVLDKNHTLKTYYVDEVENVLSTNDNLQLPKMMRPKEQFEYILENYQKDEYWFHLNDKLYLK